MTTYNVGFIVGSIASNSINRVLANALVKLAPQADLNLTEIEIKGLPFYSADFDGAIPAEATELKQSIEATDGLIVLTPEYNRSFPGVLKNALDTASRPWGQNSFAGKPAAIAGTSIGPVGSAFAQEHLREVLEFLGAPVLAEPKVAVQTVEGLFTEAGDVTDAAVEAQLLAWLNAFHAHIAAAAAAEVAAA